MDENVCRGWEISSWYTYLSLLGLHCSEVFGWVGGWVWATGDWIFF
jgi:hypothetical protein